MDIVDKLGIHERPITISCIDGGYIDLNISKEDIETFLKLDLSPDCNIYNWVNFRFQLKETKEVYSSPDSILSSTVIANSNMYLNTTWDSPRVIPIESYIDILYIMTDIERVLDKDMFLTALGDEFLFIAKINYEIALETYKKEGHGILNKTDKSTKGIVYLVKIKDSEEYKIGVTTNLDKRVSQLSIKMPFELEVITTIESDDIYSLESELHDRFDDKHINGEWFKLTKKDINYIKNYSIG